MTSPRWRRSELYRGYPTIRQDWDRFSKEFPDRYHRFSIASDHVVGEMQRLFGFDGHRVLDLVRRRRGSRRPHDAEIARPAGRLA